MWPVLVLWHAGRLRRALFRCVCERMGVQLTHSGVRLCPVVSGGHAVWRAGSLRRAMCRRVPGGIVLRTCARVRANGRMRDERGLRVRMGVRIGSLREPVRDRTGAMRVQRLLCGRRGVHRE